MTGERPFRLIKFATPKARSIALSPRQAAAIEEMNACGLFEKLCDLALDSPAALKVVDACVNGCIQGIRRRRAEKGGAE